MLRHHRFCSVTEKDERQVVVMGLFFFVLLISSVDFNVKHFNALFLFFVKGYFKKKKMDGSINLSLFILHTGL